MKKKYFVFLATLVILLISGFGLYQYIITHNSCIQVLTQATNRITGETKTFGNPCAVPFWYTNIRDYSLEKKETTINKEFQKPVDKAIESITPNQYVPPKGVLYLSEEFFSTATGSVKDSFLSGLAKKIDGCPQRIIFKKDDPYEKYMSEYSRIHNGMIVLSPYCAYDMEYGYFVQDLSDSDIVLEKIGEAEPQTLKLLGLQGLIYYRSYGGNLYYKNKLVNAHPETFHEAEGFCTLYAIAEGMVLFEEKKTEIPESVCGSKSPLRSFITSIDDYALYKGESVAYLFMGIGGSLENVETTITPLPNLDVLTIREVGTSTRSYFFSDGKKVIKVEEDRLGEYPSFPFVIKLPISDPDSFEVLSPTYTRDAFSVYFNTTKITEADTKTFEAFGSAYARDKNAAFYLGKVVQGVEPKSFGKIIDYAGGYESEPQSIARDDISLWHEDKKVMSISSGTPLYWYRKSAWIDPNIYFSDGLSIYAYSNGNLLRATVPIELLNPTDITELPKNTKLLEDRYGAMDCAGKPRWYFGIGSNLINIPIQETELVAYCKACVNCRKH